MSALVGLFEVARGVFQNLTAELAGYGLRLDDGIELRDGQGLLCYYDLEDGHIHLSLPDPSTPIGIFQAAIFRSVLACPDDEELGTLIRLMLPLLLAHELGHCLRHRAGMFGADLWFEEQVANQFAATLTERRMHPRDKAHFVGMLRRTLAHLAPRVSGAHIAVASYIDPLQALAVSGALGPSTVRSLEILESLFQVPPEQILREMPRLSPEASAHLEQRAGSIEGFNEDYTSGLAQYIYFQFGWMLIEIESPELHYVDELACRHLGHTRPLLPLIPADLPVTDEQVRALYQASRALAARTPVASRYFFKRYRAHLLDRLSAAPLARPIDTEARRLLEASDDDETILDLLSVLVPPALRGLFPAALRDAPVPDAPLPLPCETDARLWAHVAAGADDPAAATTLARLGELDRAEVYRALPAELQLEITRCLHRVRLAAHEVLFWEGSTNDDVFMLISGALEVVRGADSAAERQLARVSPGELVGDMAFVSGEPRSATLRATAPAELLVLRSAALRRLAFEHPALPMHIARVLARRLSATLARS